MPYKYRPDAESCLFVGEGMLHKLRPRQEGGTMTLRWTDANAEGDALRPMSPILLALRRALEVSQTTTGGGVGVPYWYTFQTSVTALLLSLAPCSTLINLPILPSQPFSPTKRYALPGGLRVATDNSAQDRKVFSLGSSAPVEQYLLQQGACIAPSWKMQSLLRSA